MWSSSTEMKTALDGTLATYGVSAPLWLEYVQSGFSLFMLIGGAALLTLRLAIAWREWQQGKSK